MPKAIAVFMEDGEGPVWKAYFDDIEEAKRQCQDLAQNTGFECFVYSFHTFTEIARFRGHRQISKLPRSCDSGVNRLDRADPDQKT